MCCLVSTYLLFPDWSRIHEGWTTAALNSYESLRRSIKLINQIILATIKKKKKLLNVFQAPLILNQCTSRKPLQWKENMSLSVRIYTSYPHCYICTQCKQYKRIHRKSQHAFKSFGTSTFWKQPLVKNMVQLLNLTSLLMRFVMCSLMLLIHTLCEHLSSQRGTLKCSAHCSGWNPLVLLGNTHPNWIWQK